MTLSPPAVITVAVETAATIASSCTLELFIWLVWREIGSLISLKFDIIGAIGDFL